MTDLTDKLADALEDICKNYDCDTSEGGKHFPERCRCCIAESALLVYRAQRDGERKDCVRSSAHRDELKRPVKCECGVFGKPGYMCRVCKKPLPHRRPLAKGEA